MIWVHLVERLGDLVILNDELLLVLLHLLVRVVIEFLLLTLLTKLFSNIRILNRGRTGNKKLNNLS